MRRELSDSGFRALDALDRGATCRHSYEGKPFTWGFAEFTGHALEELEIETIDGRTLGSLRDAGFVAFGWTAPSSPGTASTLVGDVSTTVAGARALESERERRGIVDVAVVYLRARPRDPLHVVRKSRWERCRKRAPLSGVLRAFCGAVVDLDAWTTGTPTGLDDLCGGCFRAAPKRPIVNLAHAEEAAGGSL